MTRYQKYMNQIHDKAIAMRVEAGALHITHDIADFLVKSGIKADSQLIKNVLNFVNYNYEPDLHSRRM